MSIEESGKKILSLNFNQTNVKKKQTLLSVGTTKGFRVLRLESSKMISKRDDDPGNPFPGGFSHVVPVFSTALICLVGSAANSRYPLNIVIFYLGLLLGRTFIRN